MDESLDKDQNHHDRKITGRRPPEPASPPPSPVPLHRKPLSEPWTTFTSLVFVSLKLLVGRIPVTKSQRKQIRSLKQGILYLYPTFKLLQTVTHLPRLRRLEIPLHYHFSSKVKTFLLLTTLWWRKDFLEKRKEKGWLWIPLNPLVRVE